MSAGLRLLLLWAAIAALWILPAAFLAGRAAFFPLWPILLYLAVAVALTLLALARSVAWLRRRRV